MVAAAAIVTIHLPNEREMDPGIVVVAVAVENNGAVNSLNIAVQERRHRLRLRRQVFVLVVGCSVLAAVLIALGKGVAFGGRVCFLAGGVDLHEGSSVVACNGDHPHSQLFGIRQFLGRALLFGRSFPSLPFRRVVVCIAVGFRRLVVLHENGFLLDLRLALLLLRRGLDLRGRELERGGRMAGWGIGGFRRRNGRGGLEIGGGERFWDRGWR